MKWRQAHVCCWHSSSGNHTGAGADTIYDIVSCAAAPTLREPSLTGERVGKPGEGLNARTYYTEREDLMVGLLEIVQVHSTADPFFGIHVA